MSEELEWDKKKILFTFGIILIIFATAAPSFYFYNRYQSVQQALISATKNNTNEIKALSEKISKHVLLPADEDPTLATISDANKLKNQPFFVNAKNGDKVLIYTKSKKAILYNPELDKIIEIGPVVVPTPGTEVLGDTTATSSATPAPLSVVLYNGTKTDNMTLSVSLILKSKDPSIQVISRENAQKNTYAKTQLINLNPSKKDAADHLSKLLSAEIVATTSGEKIPSSGDFLIIIGNDKITPSPTPSPSQQLP